MIALAFAMGVAGHVLSLFALLQGLLNPFGEGGRFEACSGGKVPPQVSEIVDHFDAFAEFAPEGLFEPLSCLSVTCEVGTFVRGYARSHLLEVLMRGIERKCKVVHTCSLQLPCLGHHLQEYSIQLRDIA